MRAGSWEEVEGRYSHKMASGEFEGGGERTGSALSPDRYPYRVLRTLVRLRPQKPIISH